MIIILEQFFFSYATIILEGKEYFLIEFMQLNAINLN